MHCSHFALDLLIACLFAAIMGRRSSAIASASRDVKQPAPRSASNLKLRAAASRLKYNNGFTLPPHHRFLLDFGSEVSPEALSTASEKLTIMEDMGLQPVSVKLLSQGSQPDHRLVQLSGAPACLQHIESRCLYSQLCDWESVAAAAREQVASLFCELQHRAFSLKRLPTKRSDRPRLWGVGLRQSLDKMVHSQILPGGSLAKDAASHLHGCEFQAISGLTCWGGSHSWKEFFSSVKAGPAPGQA